MDHLDDRRHLPEPRLPGPEERIAAVERELAAEFGGVASPATVSEVVTAARRDLDCEVPLDSLDEFLHRLAHQRLLDVCGGRRVRHAR